MEATTAALNRTMKQASSSDYEVNLKHFSHLSSICASGFRAMTMNPNLPSKADDPGAIPNVKSKFGRDNPKARTMQRLGHLVFVPGYNMFY